jgi:hypothetical protein
MIEQSCPFCKATWATPERRACERCIRTLVGERIQVVVLAAPGRDEAHALCYDSIRKSDIGDEFVISENLPGMAPAEHWKLTHDLAAEAKSRFVLVLEDDVLVNQHILYNLDTWRYKHDERSFGAGMVYAPGGYARRDTWYSGTWDWYGTCGVLYPTARLPGLIERAWARMQKEGMPWDLAITWASHLDGRRIRVHHPALVEHLNDLPSKLGNAKGGMRDSGGTFSQSWMRPDKHEHGIFDQWGRKTV